MRQLWPDFKSIDDFRKVTPRLARQLCVSSPAFYRELKLLGGQLLAIDGSMRELSAQGGMQEGWVSDSKPMRARIGVGAD